MKKFYEEPEFDVRNYAQSLDSILTVSGGDLNGSGDLNGGDDADWNKLNQNSEGIL